MVPEQTVTLTALGQHALLRLLQLLVALCGIRLQHPLTRPYTAPARHAALAPVRPRRQHAGDGICTRALGFILTHSVSLSR